MCRIPHLEVRATVRRVAEEVEMQVGFQYAILTTLATMGRVGQEASVVKAKTTVFWRQDSKTKAMGKLNKA